MLRAFSTIKPYRTHLPTPSHPNSPLVHTFFHSPTSTWTFLVSCPSSHASILIDPVLDYDPSSGVIGTSTANGIMDFVREKGYKVEKVIETHVHADHLTAARVWKKEFAVDVCVGHRVQDVQRDFGLVYGISPDEYLDSFDVLFKDDEVFRLGELQCSVLHLPGHTPDHVGIMVGDTVFAGDSIFLPDVGSARSDFPGGNPSDLFSSAQRLLSLPRTHRIFSGHDYPEAREKSCFSTVGDQRAKNLHVNERVIAEEFMKMRGDRDKTLGTPRLLHASLQVNLRGGRLPEPDEQGRRWFKTPLSGELNF